MTTKEEMVEKMMKVMERNRTGVTFAELQQACGDSAKGDYDIPVTGYNNVVLWGGVSQTFIDALNEIKMKLEPLPSSLLVYAFDGMVLGYPVAKSAKNWKKLKRTVWFPVTFSLRESKEKAA